MAPPAPPLLPSPDTSSAPVTMFVSRTTGTLARQTRHDCCPQSSMIRRGDITPFPLAGPAQPPLPAPRRRTLRPSPAQPSPETCLPCSPRPSRWPPLDRAGTMVVLGADLVSTGVVKRLRACRGSVTSLIHRKTNKRQRRAFRTGRLRPSRCTGLSVARAPQGAAVSFLPNRLWRGHLVRA